MNSFVVNECSRYSKVQQIVNAIVKDIKFGRLSKEQKLPSINQFSEAHRVARDTVEKAYKQLKTQGYIISSPSRGYFVLGERQKQIGTALLFNELTLPNQLINKHLLDFLKENESMDLLVHHFDEASCEKIAGCLATCDYYVIIRKNSRETDGQYCIDFIHTLPSDAVAILNENFPQTTKKSKGSYINLKQNIQQVLCLLATPLEKYNSITLIHSNGVPNFEPIAVGIKTWCLQKKLKFIISRQKGEGDLRQGSAYIIIDDDHLVKLLKKIKATGWVLGKDIGIISFEEAVLKEFLNISTISFNSKKKVSAEKLAKSYKSAQCNPLFVVNHRGSL